MQSISGFRYSAGSTTGAATTAQRALIRITGSATSVAIVHEIRCGQSGDAGDTQAEMLQLELRRYTSVGAGGTSLTEYPMGAGAGRSNAHSIVVDSAVSTSISVVLTDTFNVQASWLYLPSPDDRLVVPAVAAEGLELVMAAPNDSLSMVASIVWEEIPIT